MQLNPSNLEEVSLILSKRGTANKVGPYTSGAAPENLVLEKNQMDGNKSFW